jgi:outer membrane protein OmpA-like peptidoglycan-associated protein
MPLNKNYLALIILTLLPGMTQAQNKQSNRNDAELNFTIISTSGKPRSGELIMVKSLKTAKIIQGKTGAEGKLTLKIPVPYTYSILFKYFADTIKYQDIKLTAADTGAIYTIDLKYDPPRSMTLKNVFFETGLSTLKKESNPALNELVDALKSIPTLKIEIGGHTDNVGTPQSNQELSLNRANSVRTYLINHGIEPKRVIAKGYGDTEPVAINETPEGRQKNRRTQVKIISE